MAAGPTALTVEGQQTHHQHPKIGQLTPPLYITVHLLCLEIQSLLVQTEESWMQHPLPLLLKPSRPTISTPSLVRQADPPSAIQKMAQQAAHVVPPTRCSIWSRKLEHMIETMCKDCCPMQLKAARRTIYNPRLAVWGADIEGTVLSDKTLTCMVQANTNIQLPNLFP